MIFSFILNKKGGLPILHNHPNNSSNFRCHFKKGKFPPYYFCFSL